MSNAVNHSDASERLVHTTEAAQVPPRVELESRLSTANPEIRRSREWLASLRASFGSLMLVGLAIATQIWACGVDTDADKDGFYDAPELAGTLLFDCYPDDPQRHAGYPAWRDTDEDGLGDRNAVCYVCLTDAQSIPSSAEEAKEVPCEVDVVYVFNDRDCDDSDEELLEGRYFYRDADGDGLGDPNLSLAIFICPSNQDNEPPDGFVGNNLDCDDTLKTTESYRHRYYFDSDDDSHGGPFFYESCSPPPSKGYVTIGDDCDDSDPKVNPGVPRDCAETDRTRDNDCDGEFDEDEGRTWYPDSDGDGYGRSEQARIDCEPLPGYVQFGGDCDDNDPEVYPGVGECPAL